MDNLGSLENVYLIFSQRNVSNTLSVSIVISVVYFKLANVSFFFAIALSFHIKIPAIRFVPVYNV